MSTKIKSTNGTISVSPILTSSSSSITDLGDYLAPVETEYDYGTQVRLTFTPSTGYHFVEWSDHSTQNPRTITLTSDLSLTCTGAINYYSITQSTSHGTTAISCTQPAVEGKYPYGATVTMTLTPDTHYHAEERSWNFPSGLAVTYSQNYTVATFVISTFDVNADIMAIGDNVNINVTAVHCTVTGGGVKEYGSLVVLRWSKSDDNYPTVTESSWSGLPSSKVWDTQYTQVRWTATDNVSVTVTGVGRDIVVSTSVSPTDTPVVGNVTGAGTYHYGDDVELIFTITNPKYEVKTGVNPWSWTVVPAEVEYDQEYMRAIIRNIASNTNATATATVKKVKLITEATHGSITVE